MLQSQTIMVCYDKVLTRPESLIRYGLAGATGTSAHFAVLFATISIATPIIASTLGAIVGCIVNYYLARQFVFASTVPGNRALPRFVGVAAFGVAVNAAIIQTFVNFLPVGISQIIASATVFIVGFILNKLWTFNERKD